MPVLEIKRLDASHSEAQRINSSGACELLSTQKNTHTRLTRKTATNGVLLSILLSPVIFSLGSASVSLPGQAAMLRIPGNALCPLPNLPLKVSHFKQEQV